MSVSSFVFKVEVNPEGRVRVGRGQRGQLPRADDSAKSRDVECRVTARLFDFGSRDAAVALDREFHNSNGRYFRAGNPVGSYALHHEDDVVRATEIGDVEPGSRAHAARARQAESLPARARLGQSRSFPGFRAARRGP